MLRKLGLALALSGLLVSMLPTAVGAASARLQLTWHVTCSAAPGSNVTFGLNVTWTSATGHWVSASDSYTIKDGNNGFLASGSSSEGRVPASQGFYDLGSGSLGAVSAYPLNISASVQLYKGSGPNPDGAPYTFTGTCPAS